MLNEHDELALSEAFAADQRIRIANFLTPEHASTLRHVCREQLDYQFAFVFDGANRRLSAAALRRLSADDHRRVKESLRRDAGRGVGFFYGTYLIGRGQEDGAPPPPPVLTEFHAFLNSRPMLDFIAAVTGADDIESADMQCTNYAPGHYLTRHDDNVAGETRRCAYVLSLTDRWHPDWGGDCFSFLTRPACHGMRGCQK